jgi:hypothetical protein
MKMRTMNRQMFFAGGKAQDIFDKYWSQTGYLQENLEIKGGRPCTRLSIFLYLSSRGF